MRGVGCAMVYICLKVLDVFFWVLMIGAPSPPPRTKRARFSRNLKIRMYRGQQARCQYCAWRYTMEELEIDHMVPVDRGGSNEESNLQLLCRSCNKRKGIHTDAEHRRRFRRLLPRGVRAFPKRPISQKAFAFAAQNAPAASGVRAHNRDKRYNPAHRLLVAAFLGVALVCVSLTGVFQRSYMGGEYGYYLLVGGVVWVVLVSAATIRAAATGKFRRPSIKHQSENGV